MPLLSLYHYNSCYYYYPYRFGLLEMLSKFIHNSMTYMLCYILQAEKIFIVFCHVALRNLTLAIRKECILG